MAHIDRTPNWYVVWYWVDDMHFTNMKFMDYEDALEFMEECNERERQS